MDTHELRLDLKVFGSTHRDLHKYNWYHYLSLSLHQLPRSINEIQRVLNLVVRSVFGLPGLEAIRHLLQEAEAVPCSKRFNQGTGYTHWTGPYTQTQLDRGRGPKIGMPKYALFMALHFCKHQPVNKDAMIMSCASVFSIPGKHEM